MKYSLVIIAIMFLLSSVPSSAMSNGYARIVYNVNGLQDYDLHWNDKFPQGSIIKIYAEASEINHKRKVALDYIFIIKDSNGNIVDTKSFSNKFDGYKENDFITYSLQVPQGWEDGVYTAEIHIFDLLNDTVMDNYQSDITRAFLNDSSIPDIPYMERGDILNLTQAEKTKQYAMIEKIFFIDKYANKFPADRFRVEKIELDRVIAAPREPVTVSVNISNTFYEKGSTSIDLLLDNKSIDNATIEIEGSGSGQAIFKVSTEHIGNHTLEIVPTGNNTIALNTFAFFEVNSQTEFEVPTEFNILDLRADKLNVEQNKTVNITVTIENKGKDGTQPVVLYINNMLEEERQVHLNYSETKDVIFEISRPDIGAYRVSLAGSSLSQVFFVGSPTSTPAVEVSVPEVVEKKPQLRIVLGLSVLVVFISILRIYLRKRLK